MGVSLRGGVSEIPPLPDEVSNGRRYPACGQCQVGGLTGAVASQRVTEAREGSLALVGNQRVSVKA